MEVLQQFGKPGSDDSNYCEISGALCGAEISVKPLCTFYPHAFHSRCNYCKYPSVLQVLLLFPVFVPEIPRSFVGAAVLMNLGDRASSSRETFGGSSPRET